MPRGVDEIDREVFVLESDGGALHRDSSPLLLVKVVHEPQPTGELWMEDAAAACGDEMVSESCLAMIDMGKDADVSDLPAGCFPHPALNWPRRSVLWPRRERRKREKRLREWERG